ncbi:MAG: lysostaphin resistance A-like protein [Eubacteriales bacterium]
MYEEHEDHLSLDFHTGVSPENHFRTVVNVIAFLSFLLIIFQVAMAYIYPFAEEHIYRLFGGDYETYMAIMDVWDMFEYTCSFLLPLGITLLIFRDRVFRPYIPFRASMPEHAISAIFMTVAVLYVFGAVTGVISDIFESLGLPLAYYDTYLPDTPLRIFLYFLSSVILPAFVEEMIFRGYILHMLLPYGKTFAILTSAVLFGVMHLYLPQLLYASVAGILIGYFVVRSESLWIGILIHAVNNLFAFLFDMAYVFMSDEGYAVFCVILEGIVLLCGIIGVMILFISYSRGRHVQQLETNSVYSRLLDTPTALRRSLTVPMALYLLCAAYYTACNSFLI